ncbi:MAG TPA: hypothetical protein VJC00_04890 [Candidatus Nanoarchaeia archaeon]|nr:hypothetical protein [Candidatus Nanoarchaeia archaeon]
MKRGIGRKSQIPSTVFMYALAAIIIALILIFGYKTIGKMLSTSCATDSAKFKTDIKNIIAEDTSYGKKDFVRIGIPCDFEDLCFVAAEDPAELEGNEAASIYPRAQDVAESPDNVFLANLDGSIDSFLVDRFEIEGGLPIACIRQQSGELKFRVEGKGDRAVIVPVS